MQKEKNGYFCLKSNWVKEICKYPCFRVVDKSLSSNVVAKNLSKLHYYIIEQLSFKIGQLIDFSGKGLECIFFVCC